MPQEIVPSTGKEQPASSHSLAHEWAKARKDIKTTAKVRFIAYHRLLREMRRRNWVMSLTTALIIVLSLVPNFTDDMAVGLGIAGPLTAYDLIGFATVMTSIFLLAIGLLQQSDNKELKAEMVFMSAEDLNRLQRTMGTYEAPTAADLQRMYDLYDTILQRYSARQSEGDYEVFRAREREGQDRHRAAFEQEIAEQAETLASIQREIAAGEARLRAAQ